MSRFFVDPSAVGENSIVIEGDDVKHISKVLRMRIGETIEISDSVEWEYLGEIIRIDPDQVEAKIVDKQRFAREPKTRITLYQGVPKGDKMDQIIRKCTELGVSRFYPVFMARSIVKDNGRYGKKIMRYNAIAAEAAKQCRRGLIPLVCDAIRTEDILKYMQLHDLVLFPYEEEKIITIKQAIRQQDQKPRNPAIIIGPEGGFSKAEAESLIKAGAVSVSLGKTILRTETAGPAAAAMCMYELEL